jgi:hypothetical protein
MASGLWARSILVSRGLVIRYTLDDIALSNTQPCDNEFVVRTHPHVRLKGLVGQFESLPGKLSG